MSKTKILIVEDNPIVAEDIRIKLGHMEYEVVSITTTGKGAIEATDASHPEIALTDIRLGDGMDGIDAASDRKVSESQRWLATTLKSIGDGVIATDDKGKVVFMNPVAEKLTGWDQAAAVGSQVSDVFRIINEVTGNVQDDPVARVLKNGIVVGLANYTILKCKEGRMIPIADSGAPIKDDKGNIIGVVLVFRDQSEEREAQKALEESENKFRNFFVNSPYGNLICQMLRNEKNEFVDFIHIEENQAVHINTGFEMNQLVGKKASEIVNSKILTELVELYGSVISTGKPVYYEQHFDVYDRTLDVTAFPLYDDFFIINFINISERKKAEEKLKVVQKKLSKELEVMKRLHHIGSLFMEEENLNEIMEVILDTALSITGTDKGSFLIYDQKSAKIEGLSIRGFDQTWLDFRGSLDEIRGPLKKLQVTLKKKS